MVLAESLGAIKDEDGDIVGYRIRSESGDEKSIASEEIKRAIENGQLCIVNLKITKNGSVKQIERVPREIKSVREDTSSRYDIGTTLADDFFIYRLVRIENAFNSYVVGWELQAISHMTKFRCSSTFEGYPVISLDGTFQEYKFMYIDITEMDTSNIMTMQATFAECKLAELDLSNMNTYNVRSMEAMFYRTKIGRLVLNGMDTLQLECIEDMFEEACIGSIDLSKLNFANLRVSRDFILRCRADVLIAPYKRNIGFTCELLKHISNRNGRCDIDKIVIPKAWSDGACIINNVYGYEMYKVDDTEEAAEVMDSAALFGINRVIILIKDIS